MEGARLHLCRPGSRRLINRMLADIVRGTDAFSIEALGRRWSAPSAISAGAALPPARSRPWTSLSGTSRRSSSTCRLTSLLGRARESVPIYGSGGFTSYSVAAPAGPARRLGREGRLPLGEDEGRQPPGRRPCTGEGGATGDRRCRPVRRRQRRLRPQAGARALPRPMPNSARPGSRNRFRAMISTGLRLVRDRAPAALEIAAGEYGYEPFYFSRMLDAGAVDVLQADATRCGGITGFLRVRPRSPTRRTCRSPPTLLPPFTWRSAARRRACATSNGSTITCASSRCSSTGRRTPQRRPHRTRPVAPGSRPRLQAD